uniref:Aminoadipate-semialdehyde dehydrogenase n=2 Tax=Callorhinchus milii TaxID=7868 RepID=A0A4W3INV3_CALMI|eukprot:gi/632950855/ref/XP_007890965.1/ PREDICTED: acyl-CoA synthetase family member 4 [Callorhinchus milii]
MRSCKLKYVLVQKDMMVKFKDSLSTWLEFNIECNIPELDIDLVKIWWKLTNVNSLASDVVDTKSITYNKRVDLTEDSLGSTEQLKINSREYADCWTQGFMAYILHTSGTTGTPKVVRVPHQCIVPNIEHLRSIFEISPDDLIFMASPLTFDPSIVEMFVALSSGATLLIVPPVIKMMPERLAKVLFNHHKVTVIQATPTLMKRFGSELLSTVVLSANTSLRVLALGGESFPSLPVMKSWRGEGNKTHIYNLYGITEVSSWASYYKVPEEVLGSDTRLEEPVPLGFPLLGTVLEVRNDSGQVIQEGVGQVFIGGRERVCLLHDETTVCQGTMRASGDWVTLKDGYMYYLGRKDDQIKRHGKRVNLGSVQQAAERLKQVEACAVTSCEQDKMVLFIVPRHMSEQSKESAANFHTEILLALGKILPSYAIPDGVVHIDSLPFTAHGKVNITALIEIYHEEKEGRKSSCVLWRKEDLWEGICHLWKTVLNLPENRPVLSDSSMFLYSGGDSLKALKFAEEIETLIGQSVSGLLEVILNNSIQDIYNHITNIIFSDKTKDSEEFVDEKSRMKRKVWNSETEGSHSKVLKQQRTAASTFGQNSISNITAISRGSQILKQNLEVSCEYYTNIPNNIQEDVSLTEQSSDGKLPDFKSNRERNRTESTSFSERTSEFMIVKSSLIEENTLVTQESLEKGVKQPSHSSGRFFPGESPVNCRTVSLQMRWKSDTGKCVDASPLLVISGSSGSDATVYIGSHSHRMQAIEVFSGRLKWETLLGDRIESSACISRCGNFIVVGCYDGSVYVLRSDDGKTYWMFCTGNSVKSSPIVDPDHGLIYVGSHDEHIYALDIFRKECVWKLHCGGGAVFSSACLNKSPRLLYVATLGNSLLAINPDTGNIMWKHSCGKPLFSSPQCTAMSVFIGCVDGNLYCFNHQGHQIWQFLTDGPIFSSPCISSFSESDQMVICGSHDSFVYCLNEDGDLVWKFKASKQVYSIPFVYSDYGLNTEKLVAVTSTDGKIWILGAATGKLVAAYSLPGDVYSSPVLWRKTLIVGCRNNYVYCLEISTTEENS